MTVGYPRCPQIPARCRALPELVSWPVSRVCMRAVVWFCARSAAPPAALGVLSANSGSDVLSRSAAARALSLVAVLRSTKALRAFHLSNLCVSVHKYLALFKYAAMVTQASLTAQVSLEEL